MRTLTRRLTVLAVVGLLALDTARSTLTARWRRLDHEQGEIPGWAIASAAACVLGLVVYTAYNAVVTKWTAKIK